jgi:hypothetical protein
LASALADSVAWRRKGASVYGTAVLLAVQARRPKSDSCHNPFVGTDTHAHTAAPALANHGQQGRLALVLSETCLRELGRDDDAITVLDGRWAA